MGRARVPLTTAQREALMTLYAQVPRTVQVHHEWQSDAGKRLMEMIYDLMTDDNVPLRWIAVGLGLDERVLQQTVNRMDHAVRKARREGRDARP